MRIDGLQNFRDIGGLPLAAGGTTRGGVLFRSESLSAVTPAGLQEFAATDIGVIVDFRTETERDAAPDRLPDSRPFRVVELPLLEGAVGDMAKEFAGGTASVTPELLEQAMSSLPSLGELYLSMLQNGATRFAEVGRLIAASTDASPTAVIVHCTAGKDRTGVATALMLDAVGAERAAVVADYATSQEHLAGAWADGMLQMVAGYGVPLTPALRSLVTGTPPEAIEQALAWVDEQHGGSAGYLQSGGLESAELDGLRARLTA